MKKIVKLPPHIISQISASETITSFTVLLKELIENSIDANSTIIHLSIITKQNNISIEVIDNGTGINEKDFELLCEPHCTSKLTVDNNNMKFTELITEFGFRGEALSSISIISAVTVFTKTKETNTYKLNYENNKLTKKSKTPQLKFDSGTKIIANSFKIKKRVDRTKIINMIKYFQMFYKNKIKFELKINEKNIINTHINISNTDNNINITQIFNNKNINNNTNNECEYVKNMLKSFIKEETINLIKKENYKIYWGESKISVAEFVFFVNKRLVKIPKLENILNLRFCKTKSLFFYFEISIEKEFLDVNFHPAKKEILIEKNYESEFFSNLIEEIYVEIKKRENKNEAEIKMLARKCRKLDFTNIINNTNTNNINSSINNDNTNNNIKIYTNSSMTDLSNFLVNSKKTTETQKILENIKKVKTTKKEKKPCNLKSINLLKQKHKIQNKNFSCNYCSNLVSVGFFTPKDLICQQKEDMVIFDLEKFLRCFLLQKILTNFGNFDFYELISEDFSLFEVEFVDFNLKTLLFDYFSFNFINTNTNININNNNNSNKNKYKLIGIPKIFDCESFSNFEIFYSFLDEIKEIKLEKELETLEKIIEILIEKIIKKILSENQKNILEIFNKEIKKKIVRNENVDSCIKKITDLKELYRAFNR